MRWDLFWGFTLSRERLAFHLDLPEVCDRFLPFDRFAFRETVGGLFIQRRLGGPLATSLHPMSNALAPELE